MDTKLEEFVESLKKLKGTIDQASINEDGFARHGWNQVVLGKDDLTCFLGNYINKLNRYGDKEITEGLGSTIDAHIAHVNKLESTATGHFTDSAGHLIHFVPVIILTLSTIFNDVDYELFSFENIQDKKLLPKGLAVRLRSVKSQLDSIDESAETLSDKVSVINEVFWSINSGGTHRRVS